VTSTQLAHQLSHLASHYCHMIIGTTWHWQDFNWHRALRSPSEAAELLVYIYYNETACSKSWYFELKSLPKTS